MSGNWMYGLECYICHAKYPDGRYLAHQGRFFFCELHTQQAIDDWLFQPEDSGKGRVSE